MPLLEAQNIFKTYADVGIPLEVLRHLDFCLDEGQMVGVYGASGSGKSTFLHILGGLDKPTSGRVLAAGIDLGTLSTDEIANFRNREIGFVFQFYHLLPEFSALENVMLPARIAGAGKKKAADLALSALESVGLEKRLHHRPSMLSGGEQQRVAIARASVMRPRVILADEPTGNLDRETGKKVWEYLLDLNTRFGISIVAVTHNLELMEGFSNTYELRDGRLVNLATKSS